MKDTMKIKLQNMLPYLLFLTIDFYLLPFLGQNTGVAMLIMLCVMPLLAFVAAVIYGVRRGFCLLFPLLAGLLFVPTIFIYYNSSAWVYVLFYALVVLAGNGVGRLFYMKR